MSLVFICGVVFILGLSLRLWPIAQRGLWHDEIASLSFYHQGQSLWQVIEAAIADRFSPFFGLQLWLALSAGGGAIWAGRGVSVVYGALALVWAYQLAVVLSRGQRVAGLIAMSVIAFHPFFIYYSQEMRPYSALMCLTLGAYVYLFKYFESSQKKHLGLWIFILGLLLNTHFFAVLLVVHQIFLFLQVKGWRSARDAIRSYWWLITLGLVIPIFIAVKVIKNFLNPQGPWSWIGIISTPEQRLKALGGEWFGSWPLGLLLVILVIFGITVSLVRYKETLSWLLLQLLAIFAALAAFDSLLKPMLIPRYLIGLLATFLVFLICFILKWPTKSTRLVAVSGVVLATLLLLVQRPQWVASQDLYREFLTRVSQMPEAQNQPVICVSEYCEGMRVYAAQLGINLALVQQAFLDKEDFKAPTIFITDQKYHWYSWCPQAAQKAQEFPGSGRLAYLVWQGELQCR